MASAATIVLVAAFTFTRAPIVPSDTNAVHRGSEALRLCLDSGVTSNCDRFAARRDHRVDPYPPYQHLVVYPLLELGVEPGSIFRVLQALNAVALAVLALLMGLVGRRTGRPWAAPLLVLLAVASPLAWYAWATFGEAAAATLTAAVAAAALLRAPPLALFALVWLAGITKETAAPFLLALAALALVATPVAPGPLRRAHWMALGAGLVLAVAAHVGLNELRFGQPTNAIYTDPVLRVPTTGLKARFALSLWAAPNGGTALFWPSVTLTFAGLAGVALARRGRAPSALLLLALLAGHTALLASWWSPFGWVAWGPRLMLPLLPALALSAVVLHLDDFERMLRRIASLPLARIAVVAVLALATVPQVGVLFEPQAMNELFFGVPPNSHCPADANISGNPGGYYGCVIDTAWRRPLTLVNAASGVGRGLGPLFLLSAAASVVLLALAATGAAAMRAHRHT